MSFVLPGQLTHNFDPRRGPFRNVCDLPEVEAERVLDEIRKEGTRRIAPSYLRRRMATEAWLRREARIALPETRRSRPIYFFVGDFADGRDPSRPHSIVLPLSAFPVDAITFTYPDSMASYALAADPDLASLRQDHHGRVMTLPEVSEVVARHGLPRPRWPRDAGALSDGFVEAQVWDDGPIRVALAVDHRGTA